MSRHHHDHANGNDNNDNVEMITAMIVCTDCGHLVPESNLAIHQATACGGRARHVHHHGHEHGPTTLSTNSNLGESLQEQHDPTTLVGLRQRRMTTNNNNNNNNASSSFKTEKPPSTTTTNTRHIDSHGNDIHSSEARRMELQNDVVDLTSGGASGQQQQYEHDDNNYEQQQNQQQDNDIEIEDIDGDDDDDVEEQWACPRCTLLNSVSDSYCNACRYRNDKESGDGSSSYVRPPDEILRDRLIQSNDNDADYLRMHTSPTTYNNISNNNDTTNNNSFQSIAGGALVGTLLGAAGAHWNGRPVSSGMMEGAVTGLVGGAFLGEILRDLQQQPFVSSTSTPHATPQQQQQQQQQQQPYSSSSVHYDNATISSMEQQQQQQSRDMASARSSASMGLPGYPSTFTSARVGSDHEVHDLTTTTTTTTTTTESSSSPPDSPTLHIPRRGSRAQPRGSIRVVRHSNTNNGGRGVTTTVYTSNGSTTTTTYNDANHPVARDPLLNLMMNTLMQDDTEREARLMSMIASGGIHPYGHLHQQQQVDGMSYDQLLQAFGDGTDNLGASESDIYSLPTAQIQDPQKDLPSDQQQCSICLEDFQAGDIRKTLPCLHGFHEECVNKWLRSNGSCPICKHKVAS